MARPRSRLLLTALLVAGAIASGASSVAAANTAPRRLVGINAQFLPARQNVAGRRRAFSRIRALKVGVARIDASWAQIERAPGMYDWSSLDNQVSELLSQGLRPEIILDYSNPLYSKRGAALQDAGFQGAPPFGIGAPIYYPPDSPTPFARWAAKLAWRYRDSVHLFEVWNEENLGWRFWEPHEDPAAYATLLKLTYRAIKIRLPRDQIAFGGTFYPAIDAASAAADGIPLPSAGAAQELALPHQGTLDFLDHALAAAPDLGRYFDAVAYHPYHFPYMAPEVNIPLEGTTEGSMIAVRTLLARHRLGSKPIWITEVGWPNNTLAYGATPAKSASYLVRTYTSAWAHGINAVFWYCYGDGADWAYNQESAFGIVDSAGNPKPAYYAWRTLDRLLLTLRFRGSRAHALKLPDDGHALQFASPKRSVTVVWLSPETMFTDQGLSQTADQRVSVRTPRGARAIVDMTGHRLALRSTFEASPYPVYVIGR